MNNYIRGGQVILHRVRMFWQVTKVLFKVSVGFVILSFGYSLYTNTKVNDWNIYLKHINSSVMSTFDGFKLVEFSNDSGRKYKVVAKYFDENYFVRQALNRINQAIYNGVFLSLLAVGFIVLAAIGFFWWTGGSIKSVKNIRGSFLIPLRSLRRLIKKHNKKFQDYKPFKIADTPYAGQGSKYSYTSGEQSHTLIIGATGSGKTKIIKNLLLQLHERKQKAIIIDVKGDYIKNFYWQKGGGIILNPMDKRGVNWNIWGETDHLRGFHTIAKGLLPKDSKNDPIWNEAARLVFAELAKMYWNEDLSLSDFADKILKTDIKTLEKLLEKTPASKLINENLEKAALSVLMVLSNYLTPMRLYRSNKDCFSINDWVKDESKSGFLFISSLVEAKEDLNPIISAQVSIAVNAIRSKRSESKDPKIWFILDELPYFSDQIANLQDGLTTARSSGGCFVLGTQDMSSLEKIYGDKTTKTIANNCRTKLFLSVDNEASQWCSKALGEGEVEEWNEGLSYGAHEMRDGVNVNRSRVTRRAVLPSEFANLKVGQGYIKVSGFNPSEFKASRFSWLNNVASPFVENAALVGVLTKEIRESQRRRRELEEKMKLINSGKKIDPNFALNEKNEEKARIKKTKIKKIKIKQSEKENVMQELEI